MKTILFLLAGSLLLISCGQDHTTNQAPRLAVTGIIWEGSANQDPQLKQKLDETMQCLESLNAPIIKRADLMQDPAPYTIVVKDQFLCGSDAASAWGCYYNGIIYFAESYYEIAATQGTIDDDVFKHEVIHWATGLGNEAHGSIYFTQCAAPPQ